MQAGEHLLSRSYHTLLCLVLIGNFLSSNKEEHQTARNQQAEHDEQVFLVCFYFLCIFRYM